MNISPKRIYEKFSPDDGARILVDRLWPRGVSKEKARLTLWMKDIAPSTELRTWFGHDEKKWSGFQKKYRIELKGNEDLLKELRKIARKHKKLTLLYGTKDTAHNEAVVIKDVLLNRR